MRQWLYALNHHHWQVENWKRKATETCSTSNQLLAAGQWIIDSNFVEEPGQTRKNSICWSQTKINNHVAFNQEQIRWEQIPLEQYMRTFLVFIWISSFIMLTSFVVWLGFCLAISVHRDSACLPWERIDKDFWGGLKQTGFFFVCPSS